MRHLIMQQKTQSLSAVSDLLYFRIFASEKLIKA